MAASILVAVTVWTATRPTPAPVENVSQIASSLPIEYVARITGAKGSVWGDDSASLTTGTFLRRGERLDLADGFAEVTFDSGAVVLLEGPATLEVNSAWDSTLRRAAPLRACWLLEEARRGPTAETRGRSLPKADGKPVRGVGAV